MSDREFWWQAMWIMHDMCMYRVPRLDTFKRLRTLGMDRRQAVELIQSHEREP